MIEREALELVRGKLLGLLAELDQLLESGGYEGFKAQVEQVLDQYWGDRADFTEESYQRLYQLSRGDLPVVRDFLIRAAYRKQRGWSPSSLAGYTISTFRKVGVDQLRADRERRRASKNGSHPPEGPAVVHDTNPIPEEMTGISADLSEFMALFRD